MPLPIDESGGQSPVPGAHDLGGGRCRFVVWAPFARKVEVHFFKPQERFVPLVADDLGYHQTVVEGVEPGNLYCYRLDNTREFPDPASRYQPQGVHGPSQVVNDEFNWDDEDWSGLPLESYILYEIHVGTFTPEGTFDAIHRYLDDLKLLGITAVELMPVAQFPGTRNWGYDGVDLFSVQNSYGGPDALKRLVNACHQRGIAVVLDVVYNHLGPEGNYLGEFGPYFTDRYKTPWGPALNFDGPYSDHVRHFFIQNALYWINDFRIDALRLDAVHAILDQSAKHLLEELAEAILVARRRLKRDIYLMPESDRNDPRLVLSPQFGGYGLDAVWSDDFHHSLHSLMTEERDGYYVDFGEVSHLAKAFREGFTYCGQYSTYRKHRHGRSPRNLEAEQHVVCAQNHDQVGNRMSGERLTRLVPFEGLKLAAAVVLLSPYLPLLFMGEEYGETAPFLYFVSHSDTGIIEATRRGRREEFSAFRWAGEPPDPQEESTFLTSKLNHHLRQEGNHRLLNLFYQTLIALRREIPALSRLSKKDMRVQEFEPQQILLVHRWTDDSEALMVFHFGHKLVSSSLPVPPGRWRNILDSSAHEWNGDGGKVSDEVNSTGEVPLSLQPSSVVLFIAAKEGYDLKSSIPILIRRKVN